MSKNRILLLVGGLLLVVGVLFIVSVRWSPKTERIDLGPGAEARRNHFLALGKFLESQYGWIVNSSYTYKQDEYVDLTIAPLELLPVEEERDDPNPAADFLLTGPGELPPGIELPPQYRNRWLLRRLGIQSLQDRGTLERNPLSWNPSSDPDPAEEVEVAELDGESFNYAGSTRFDLQFTSPLLPPIVGRSEQVMCLEDLNMLSNDAIDRHDHILIADLAFQEFGLPPGSRVRIVYGSYSQTLWEWLFGRGWLVTLLILFVVVAVVWHALPRLGPILIEPASERRSLAEHLHAAARFLLSYRHQDALYGPARRAIQERLRQRSPRADREHRLLWAARSSPFTESQIEHALSGSVDRRQVVRTAQILQVLQQKI
jgi:hypothetical protein